MNDVERILVIDDEIEIRESLEALLDLEGYEVDLAQNAAEGERRLESRAYDLVLLDLDEDLDEGVLEHVRREVVVAEVPPEVAVELPFVPADQGAEVGRLAVPDPGQQVLVGIPGQGVGAHPGMIYARRRRGVRSDHVSSCCRLGRVRNRSLDVVTGIRRG